jgi:hypothetical protein
MGFGLLAATSAACAQTCSLPVPFKYVFQTQATATLSSTNPGDPCGLSVALGNAAGPTASGFLHYQRAHPLTSVRYGFRVDTQALSPMHGGIQLFSANAPVAPIAPGIPQSGVLTISLVQDSPNPMLRFFAARSGNQGAQSANPELSPGLHTIRVQIAVGSGTAGSVRFWIDHAFSDPPDGVLDNGGAGLDNAAWVGVIGAELGVSTADAFFRANHAGAIVAFDQIESSDDLLFFDDFSSGAQ